MTVRTLMINVWQDGGSWLEQMEWRPESGSYLNRHRPPERGQSRLWRQHQPAGRWDASVIISHLTRDDGEEDDIINNSNNNNQCDS